MKTYSAYRTHEATSLLKLDSFGRIQTMNLWDLTNDLTSDDLLIFNDSATLPSSFYVMNEPTLEVRLASFAGFAGSSRSEPTDWWAILFGEGTWESATESRGKPRAVRKGDSLPLSANLRAEVLEVDATNPRLIKLRFSSSDLINEIYRVGKPIQYSYHRAELAIWDVQTIFARVPISVEPPSAALQFNWSLYRSLKCEIAFITHGAGLSSTGDATLDRRLPLPEYYSIPKETWQKLERTKGRVVAVGTTVARALESANRTGRLEGFTSLKLGGHERAQVIDGILTGFHEPSTSHFELEQALTTHKLATNAYEHAGQQGFREHEFGDLLLIEKVKVS